VFDKYTERARLVLFFARYEASELGSVEINSDHLLLGLIRQWKGLTGRLIANSGVSAEELRKELEGRAVFREKLSTSVEIPFTDDVTRVLKRAAEEARQLGHDYIGAEHLLIALLREENCPAGTLLIKKGMRVDAVRAKLLELLHEGGTEMPHDGTRQWITWESMNCCFCGELFPVEASAVQIVISRVDRQSRQNLAAHPHCLRSRVRSDIPLITDAGDE
jgi:ATP-dependent Clp protease ATP-binding subunit ClpC